MGTILAVRSCFWAGAWMTFLGLYLSISLLWIGLGLFLFTGLLISIRTRNVSWFFQNPLFFPVVCLASVMSLSVILSSPYPFKGAIPKIILPFFVFLFAWFFQMFPNSKKQLVKMCVCLGLFMGVLSLIQSVGIFSAYFPSLSRYVYHLPHNPNLHLAVGFTRHHTTFAFSLIVLFHALLGQGIFSNDSRKKIVFFLGCAFCVVGILFSFSRGSWLALVLSLGLVLLIHSYKALIQMLLVFGSLLLGLFFSDPTFQQRIRSFRLEENSERFELWKVCWKMFRESPWFGQGYDSFGSKIGLFSNLPLSSPQTPLDPHSMYLEFLATSGLFGFLCFLVFLGSMFRLAFQSSKTNPWFLSTIGVLTAFSIGGFFDRYFDMPHTIVPVLWFVGLCLSERATNPNSPVKSGS